MGVGEPASSSAEHVLEGGNVAEVVVRVGSTVRKPAGVATAAVEALLDHLAEVGSSAAPRSLGRDELGRHVLEYIPGDLAYAAKTFVSLCAGGDPGRDGPRLRALADGYVLDEQQRRALPALIVAHTRGMFGLLQSASLTGEQPWARLYAGGHGDHWGPAADYVEAHLERWTAALLK